MKNKDTSKDISMNAEDMNEEMAYRDRRGQDRDLESRFEEERDSLAYMHRGMLYVDPTLASPNEVLGFVVLSCRGEPQEKAEHTAMHNGWTPKDVSHVPELQKYARGMLGQRNRDAEVNYFYVGGQVLCRRDKEVDRQKRKQAADVNHAQNEIARWTTQRTDRQGNQFTPTLHQGTRLRSGGTAGWY